MKLRRQFLLGLNKNIRKKFVVVIADNDKDYYVEMRKRLGRHRFYGSSMFAHSAFGDDEISIVYAQYGDLRLGVDRYGSLHQVTGIYHVRTQNGGRKQLRTRYYITKNPRTIPQQSNRNKFANAVTAWQGLNQNEKSDYRRRSKGLHMSGYNVFLREYLNLN